MTTSAPSQSMASTSPTVSSLVPTSDQMRETSISGWSAISMNHVTTADAHNSISSDGAQPTTNRIMSNESYGVLSSTSHGVISQIISTSETSIYDSSTTPVNHFTTSDALRSGFAGGNQYTTVGRQMSLKPGQGNKNGITDFFGQPAGIAVASAGLAALLIIFGCLAWKLVSSESGIMIQCYRVTV